MILGAASAVRMGNYGGNFEIKQILEFHFHLEISKNAKRY